MDSTSRPRPRPSPSEPASAAFLADVEEVVAGLAAADARDAAGLAAEVAARLAAALEEEPS